MGSLCRGNVVPSGKGGVHQHPSNNQNTVQSNISVRNWSEKKPEAKPLILWLFLPINMPVECPSKPMHEIPHCHSWDSYILPWCIHPALPHPCWAAGRQWQDRQQSSFTPRAAQALPHTRSTHANTPDLHPLGHGLAWGRGAGPQSPWCEDWWFVSSLSAGKTPAHPAVAPWVLGQPRARFAPSPQPALIWAPTDLRTVLRTAPLLLCKASGRMGYPRHEFTDYLQCKHSDKKKKSHKTKIGNNIQMWHFRRSISGYCPPTQVLSWNWSK